MTITGDTTKVITLFQRGGSTVTGSFTDNAGTGGGGGSGASVTISTSPPVSPSAGSLWFNSESGALYIYYDDGNSQQWVAPDNNGIGFNAVTMDASVSGVLSVSNQQISGVDPNADRILFWDDSESKLAHLSVGSGLSISGNTLSATAGKVAQVVYAQDATQKTSAVVIPTDDTIPQNTEGTAYTELDTSITPTNINSRLLIELQCAGWTATTNRCPVVCLFRDSDANALAIGHVAMPTATFSNVTPVRAMVNANSTTTTTFKVRFGVTTAGSTVYLNDYASTPYWGGSFFSSIIITEILP
jgi:hypothetical protein